MKTHPPAHHNVVTTKILVVEDHAPVRRSIVDWLASSFDNCRFRQAGTGEEGLAVALAEPPDIVLIDVGLPQMSGIEATRRIKAALPETKVVVLSMHEEPSYREDAMAAGAAFYVPKRTMHAELLPILAGLLP